jgi:hypothetical protein
MALDFVEPGSCKNPPKFFSQIKVYPDLQLKGKTEASILNPGSGALAFNVGQKDMMPKGWESKKLWIGWANGDNMIQVRALFPCFMTWLTSPSTRQ